MCLLSIGEGRADETVSSVRVDGLGLCEEKETLLPGVKRSHAKAPRNGSLMVRLRKSRKEARKTGTPGMARPLGHQAQHRALSRADVS